LSQTIKAIFQKIDFAALVHVGASYISLAPAFFKSQSALIALLLLSKSNPLRWASIWSWIQT
jgi:hypothetical protein